MMTIRRAAERGASRLDWLDSRHTFSFAEYIDPAHMGFGALRVINDDRVAPGGGFGTHGHRDMEILTWVLSGALAHRDSLGNGSILRQHELQRMTAGTGVLHSEFNASDAEPVHFLQIWIRPDRTGLPPGYEQKAFPQDGTNGGFRLIASPDGYDGALTLHQDANLLVATLAAGETTQASLAPQRKAWLQVAKGRVQIGDTSLAEGDGASFRDTRDIAIRAEEDAQVLLFDLA